MSYLTARHADSPGLSFETEKEEACLESFTSKN